MYNIEEVYKEYAKTVYKYLLCITSDSELSEDLTQETFYCAMKEIDKFNGKCKISVWLCQIAKYLWYGHIRKEKLGNKISIDDIETMAEIDKSIENEIINKLKKEYLYKKIENLDSTTKKVILYRIQGELSFKEIADILNKTETWARITFYRGKQKLKEESLNEDKSRL